MKKQMYVALAKVLRNFEMPHDEKMKLATRMAKAITENTGVWNKKMFLDIISQELE